MRVSRVVTIPFLAAGVMFAAVPAAVDQAASLVEQRAAQMPKGQALEFRLLAAQSLQAGYPGLAHKFIDAVVQELRANPSEASASVKYTLAGLDPTDAATLFPPQPDVPKPAPGSRAQAGRKPVAAISEKMGTMRGLPTDADRAKVAIEATVAIRALPPDISKLSLSYSLANLVTEGDLGKEALNATASTLALALKENPATPASYYVGLARLVRYEHLAPLPADPVLDTATALLELHDQIVQGGRFFAGGARREDLQSRCSPRKSSPAEFLGHLVSAVPPRDAGHGKVVPAFRIEGAGGVGGPPTKSARR